MPTLQRLTRTFEARTIDVSTSGRTVTARINTGIVDRYGTVIDPATLRTVDYMRNPVVLWEHGDDPGRGSLPIGRCLDIKRGRMETIARTQFHDDEFSEALWRLYEAEICRGWSIYAMPDRDQTSKPTSEEIRDHPDWTKARLIYRNADLGEFSAVSVPGNPDTLTIAVERGLVIPESIRRSLTSGPPRIVDKQGEDWFFKPPRSHLERLGRRMKDNADDKAHDDHQVIKDSDGKHYVELSRSGRLMPRQGCDEKSEATRLARSLNGHHSPLTEEYGDDEDAGRAGGKHPDHSVIRDGDAYHIKLARCARCVPKRGMADKAEAGELCRHLNAHHDHLAAEYGAQDGGDRDDEGDEDAEGERSAPHLPSLKSARSLAQIEAKIQAALKPLAGSIRRRIISDAGDLARGKV